MAPAEHVYVERVVDPREVDLVAAPLDDLTRWLAGRDGHPEVLHLHLGLRPIADLSSVEVAVRAARLPLVVTFHDHLDPGDHGNDLGTLCRSAAAVVVHDAADAGVLRQRWGVEAYVHPYPHVADLATVKARLARQRRAPWQFGIVWSRGDPAATALRQVIGRALRDHDDVVVDETVPPLDDPGRPDVVAAVAQLDGLVLTTGVPARRAWVELARDLGVVVVAPAAPAVVEHGVVVTYPARDEASWDLEVARAIDRARAGMPAAAAVAGDRVEECNRVRAAHTALYRAMRAAAGTPDNHEGDDERAVRGTW